MRSFLYGKTLNIQLASSPRDSRFLLSTSCFRAAHRTSLAIKPCQAADMAKHSLRSGTAASGPVPHSLPGPKAAGTVNTAVLDQATDIRTPIVQSSAELVKSRKRSKRPVTAAAAQLAQPASAVSGEQAAVKLEAIQNPARPARRRKEPVPPATSVDPATGAAAVKHEPQAAAPVRAAARPKRSRKKPAAAAAADAPVSSTAEMAPPAANPSKRAPRESAGKAAQGFTAVLKQAEEAAARAGQALNAAAEQQRAADVQQQPVLASAEAAAPPAAKPRQSRKKPAAAAPAAVVKQEDMPAEPAAEAPAVPAKPKRSRKKPAADTAVKAEAEIAQQPDVEVKAPPKKRARKAAAAVKEEPAEAGSQEGQADPVKVPKRKRRGLTENPFEIPGREMLVTAATLTIPPRPVPNLGYACLNMDLREQKPPIFTNRDCIKKSFTDKGLPFVSQLALENAKALAGLVQWNHEHNIRFFRMTSNVFPWCTEYDLEELPDFAAISEELAFAGKLARAYDQRLTFHPSHFVKLAAAEPKLLARSIKELEVHSQMLDLMGYEKASPVNKINIHVGGVYGDKDETLKRFAVGYGKLSGRAQARLTVENDDLANSFSVADLMKLHEMIKMPIVFDFHHFKFCKGDQTADEALRDALSTWPEGVRPVVHWSESQVGRIDHAHSDYVYGPMDLLGREQDIDVMIESKCKERALRAFRGDAGVLLPKKLTQADLDQAQAAATGQTGPSPAFQYA